MDKTALRRELLGMRRSIPENDRERLGEQIRGRVLELPEWKNARTVGCYLALSDEVPTRELVSQAWAEGKVVAAPVIRPDRKDMRFHIFTSWSQLRAGPMNIEEPVAGEQLPPERLDLLLVPGVGFDLRGYRLGYGKGFFDRFLGRFTGWSVGLAFEVQIVPELVLTPSDRPVNLVITERRRLPA
jgi:5-formyltetrahydrofolate cyclo-ligase